MEFTNMSQYESEYDADNDADNDADSEPDFESSGIAGEIKADTAAPQKTLSLMKGKHHFCFRYEKGDETQVLEALVDLVNRKEHSFDWFDAAVMSHQLGQHLAKEFQSYLPKKAA